MNNYLTKSLIVVSAFLLVFGFFSADTHARSRGVNEGYVEPHLLEVHSAEFAADPYNVSAYDPFIKLRVYNNSTERINRAFFLLRLVADGREVLSTRFVKIPRTYLQPYTTATWLLHPRGSSAWAMRSIPSDAKLEVEVQKVFCPKRNSPWQPEFNFQIPRRRDFLR